MAFEDEADVLYKFEYHLQDHLGNTRVVFGGHSNGKAELVQQTDYYPFGLVMAQREYLSYDDFPENQVLANKYLYNGKEWQDEEIGGAKLDWYDYGARMYDPELGRWQSVDPLAENRYSITPYHYVRNNPLKLIDINGLYDLDPIDVYGKEPSWLKRFFRRVGNLLKNLTSEGSGDSSDGGGTHLVKTGQSYSPTKDRSKYKDQLNVDDLAPVMGNIPGGRLGGPLSGAEFIDKLFQLNQAIYDQERKSKPTSDEEIREGSGGSQKQKTDGTGKIIKKVESKKQNSLRRDSIITSKGSKIDTMWTWFPDDSDTTIWVRWNENPHAWGASRSEPPSFYKIGTK